jgi:hypothetical protein
MFEQASEEGFTTAMAILKTEATIKQLHDAIAATDKKFHNREEGQDFVDLSFFFFDDDLVMKKRTLANLGYACAIFFYIDLTTITFASFGGDLVQTYQIKRDAKQVLDTPDLTTGLEQNIKTNS